MAQGQGVTCRTCGYTSPHGTPTCGNCAADLGSQGASARPVAAPRSGVRRAVAALLLLGLLGGGLSSVAGQIDGALDWFRDTTSSDGAPRPEIARPATIDESRIAFRRVPEVARALRAGGLPCVEVDVDSADDYVATGSCQSRGAHVQINLYFTPETIRFARRELFARDSAFAFAHADNWWVVSQPGVVRRAQRILGGRVQVPR